MKKKKTFTLKTVTEIKVFILFLLDEIAYPIDHSSFIDILADTTKDISLGYDEALRELSESGHINFDEIGSERYYMISDMGKMVAKELYNTLDQDFLNESLKIARKYISFANGSVKTSATISECENKRFIVNLVAENSEGELLNLDLTVKTSLEADRIKANFEAHPERIYRGVLYAATGYTEYFN